jgi:hypothetical protein
MYYKKAGIAAGLGNSYYRYNLNTIGKMFLTLTGTPLCFPGLHLGAIFSTLIASSSHPAPIPFTT